MEQVAGLIQELRDGAFTEVFPSPVPAPVVSSVICLATDSDNNVCTGAILPPGGTCSGDYTCLNLKHAEIGNVMGLETDSPEKRLSILPTKSASLTSVLATNIQ